MIQRTRERIGGSRSLTLGVLPVVLIAAWLALAASPAHAATTFTVNSTGDAGDNNPGDGSCYTGFFIPAGPFFVQECTLRTAIQEANATTGTDTINFNIPTAGVATIAPASALPTITDPVTIDGYSQPGARPNTPGDPGRLALVEREVVVGVLEPASIRHRPPVLGSG
jgi:CSLREA domain-containing protein